MHVSILVPALLPMAAGALAKSDPAIHVVDGHGRTVARFEAGDTLAVRVDGLDPLAAYDLVLRDDRDEVLGFSSSAADLEGRLGPDVLWWESGVTGVDPGGLGDRCDGFLAFAEAEAFLASHPIRVELRRADRDHPGEGPLVASHDVAVNAPRTTPNLWFSDGTGDYRTAFESGFETIHVSGDRFPAGAVVDLFVVADRTEWRPGDPIEDLTGFGGVPHKERVFLPPGATSFSIPVWPGAYQRAGRFDLIARVNDAATGTRTELRATDLIFHGSETGLHVRAAASSVPRASSDLEANLAGIKTTKNHFPGFRFLPHFLRHTKIFSALDPNDVPADHVDREFARIHVVEARNTAQWRKNPWLSDVTEAVETRKVKAGTLEAGIFAIWNDPDPLTGSLRYDVVLDFRADYTADPGAEGTGAPPPPTGGTKLLWDGIYDPGVDIIDHLEGDGFDLLEDPSETGPYPVGRTSYEFDDAYDIQWGQYQDQNVDVRAVVAYPGQSTGVDVPVFGTGEKYPVIVILHGNHNVCLNFACTCSKSNRIPNHWGYDYLLDLWASHGFIAISVDGYDITGCPTDRFIERGALMIEHLNYWKDWNDPTVPDATFSGRFWDRLDLDRIGFAGHSRGGEGAAAAVQFNQDLALGWNIRALVTIAPTDYNWSTPPGGGPIEFVVEDTPMFNIMGSSDGDVFDNQGVQLFDRAAPDGQRATKSQAYIYGADHNSWNTIWIDPGWNGGSDGVGGNRITADQQQDTGRVYITSWWMAFLQDRVEMLEFHRGVLDSPKLADVDTYWTFEAEDALDVDHFQDTPKDKLLNSLGGANAANPTPNPWKENSLREGAYDGSFYHDTDGLILGWSALTTYEVDVPAANQDVSGFGHFALKVTQIDDASNPTGSQEFLVNLEDVNGVRQAVDVNSRGFYEIPRGYDHPWTGRKSMLSTVRIPLRAFTQNQSGVDLTRIAKIIITFQNTGLMAFDELQFTK